MLVTRHCSLPLPAATLAWHLQVAFLACPSEWKSSSALLALYAPSSIQTPTTAKPAWPLGFLHPLKLMTYLFAKPGVNLL